MDDFREAAPVLDLGCGRGEFLGLLREAGVEARGVDADADMVAFARGEGLDVEQGDALAALEALDEGSLGGIFLAQVVEPVEVEEFRMGAAETYDVIVEPKEEAYCIFAEAMDRSGYAAVFAGVCHCYDR